MIHGYAPDEGQPVCSPLGSVGAAVVIDGGKTQVRAAMQALADHGLVINIVGLAKRKKTLIFWQNNKFKTANLPMDSPALILLKAIRDEAHRFATIYHKKLRRIKLLNG